MFKENFFYFSFDLNDKIGTFYSKWEKILLTLINQIINVFIINFHNLMNTKSFSKEYSQLLTEKDESIAHQIFIWLFLINPGKNQTNKSLCKDNTLSSLKISICFRKSKGRKIEKMLNIKSFTRCTCSKRG